MYAKENGEGQQWYRNRSDERVVGKINLLNGVLAVILLAGAVAVILLLAFGENRWALGAGVLAAALFVLALWDPARVLKKHSRADWRLDGEAPEDLKR